MSAVILAYIPVLHQGYYQLFKENTTAQTLYILSDELATQFTPVHKELRALNSALIVSAIKSWGFFETVQIADITTLAKLNEKKSLIIIPDEVVTDQVVNHHLPACQVTRSNIFLRWDKESATDVHQPQTNEVITSDQADQYFMQQAVSEGKKSSDWWRQVGAIAVRDKQILAITHNTHLPSEQQQYAEGDPRAHFHKGDHIELTTAIHAEAKLIAEAAASGLKLKNADLYVTDFPCPPCAKLIAHAGIKKVYFAKGYTMLDGERVLKTNNIKIIQVKDN